MPTLEAVEAFLVVNENELMQDFLIGLMAAPQLAVFFEKFPRLRSILEGEIPSWRNRLERRIKETSVPEDLAHEFTLYQHQLGLQSADFFQQLSETLAILRQHQSPFIYEAESLCPDGATPRSISFQTLFLQRWRLSLIARTLTLHHQVLDEERELLQAELQQRMQISGALEPVLVDNENAAGKLWDLSKGELHHGDYQLMVQYGDFLAQQPELKKLAEQLGRSRASTAEDKQSTEQEVARVMVREPAIMPEEVSGIHQSDDILRLLPTELSMLGMEELEFEFYR